MKLRVLVALGLLAGTARADDHITGHRVDRPTDGLVIGSALGVAFAASLIPMRSHELWDHELFGDADATVHDQFSPRAKTISDVMIAVDIAAPALYLASPSIDDAYGDRMLIYGEVLAIDIALFEAVKH